jgi:negative regulator of replication initiation
MQQAVSSLSPFCSTFKFRVQRAFKALDDGTRRKWVVVAAARDLPLHLPLDANARVPNVIKNRPACAEMRATLLNTPDLFQVFNGGIVCTATSVESKQEGNDHVVEVAFDDEAAQGVVNGGHTYATLLHVLHDNSDYSEGKDLKSVLAQDGRAFPEMAGLACDDEKLAERISRARARAHVQIEFVAPVEGSELLAQIARARNLSQSVEATALQNLAGKFDLMKEVLRNARPAPPFGPEFVDRVVWKTNQEVPEESQAVPVKLLIHVLALMNIRAFPAATKTANEVYMRSGIVIREFGEAEGEDERFYQNLTRLLPDFIRLYDHIYAALPEIDPAYPWADGKFENERKRRRGGATTPILGMPCASKVLSTFVWPIYSAFRLLLIEKGDGTLGFRTDPIAFFDDVKSTLVTGVQSFHRNQAHGVVAQLGKDKEVWLRLQAEIEKELTVRQRLGVVAGDEPASKPKPAGGRPAAVDSGTSEISIAIATPQYRALKTAVDRLMYVLRWAHERHPEAFNRVASTIARKNKYFSKAQHDLNHGKQIYGSSLWVETCNDTPRKQLILGEVLEGLRYDASAVAEAKRSLAENAPPRATAVRQPPDMIEGNEG